MKTNIIYIAAFFTLLISVSAIEAKASYWDARRADTIEAYEEFLKENPDGEKAEKAKSRLEDLYFEKAKKANDIAVVEDYLKKYPNGKYRAESKIILDELYFGKAQKSNLVADYERYLRKYPKGIHIGEVRPILENHYYTKAKNSNDIEDYETYLKKYPQGAHAEKFAATLEELYREKIITSGSVADCEAYLSSFPNGKYAEETRIILDELKLYETAKKSDSVETYRLYMEKYPEGKFAAESKSALDDLYYDRSLALGTIGAFEEYLRLYPDGKNTLRTKYIIEDLLFKRAVKINTQEAYEEYLKKYPNGYFSYEAEKKSSFIKDAAAFRKIKSVKFEISIRKKGMPDAIDPEAEAFMQRIFADSGITAGKTALRPDGLFRLYATVAELCGASGYEAGRRENCPKVQAAVKLEWIVDGRAVRSGFGFASYPREKFMKSAPIEKLMTISINDAILAAYVDILFQLKQNAKIGVFITKQYSFADYAVLWALDERSSFADLKLYLPQLKNVTASRGSEEDDVKRAEALERRILQAPKPAAVESMPATVEENIDGCGEIISGLKDVLSNRPAKLENKLDEIFNAFSPRPDQYIQCWEAAANIVGAAGPEIVPQLISALNNINPRLRMFATEAIGKIKPASSLGVLALIDALDDPDHGVAEVVSESLANMRADALALLIDRMRSSKPQRASMIANAIGKMGPAGGDAIFELTKIERRIRGDAESGYDYDAVAGAIKNISVGAK